MSLFATKCRSINTEQESVNYSNLSENIVNSATDVAKTKPRKLPAVEIRCKLIGNIRSNKKQPSKC